MANSAGWVKGIFLALLGLTALIAVALRAIGIPTIAAGMATKGVCSAAFVAGRSVDRLMADDVLPASPVLKLISVDVDEVKRDGAMKVGR